jgi:hypothetical protein
MFTCGLYLLPLNPITPQASWFNLNALSRLVAIALVCNKARFLMGQEGEEEGVCGEEEGVTFRCMVHGEQVCWHVSLCACQLFQMRFLHATCSWLNRGKYSLLTWHMRVIAVASRVACTCLLAGAVAAPIKGYGSKLDNRKVAGDATDIGLLRFADALAPEGVVRQVGQGC